MLRLLPLLTLLACSTVSPRPTLTSAELFGAPAPPETAESWARRYRSVGACEREARLEQSIWGQRAFERLEACIKRDPYLELSVLTTHWRKELKNRPEAVALLMRVMAARATVRADLQELARAEVPLFDLSTAMMRAPVFKDRLVVFMAELRDSPTAQTLTLVEVVPTTERIEVDAQESKRVVSVAQRQGSDWGDVERTRVRTLGKTETRYVSSMNETGREIIARLSNPSLFLSSERPHLFVARFRGAKKLDPKLDDAAALVDLVAFHEL